MNPDRDIVVLVSVCHWDYLEEEGLEQSVRFWTGIDVDPLIEVVVSSYNNVKISSM